MFNILNFLKGKSLKSKVPVLPVSDAAIIERKRESDLDALLAGLRGARIEDYRVKIEEEMSNISLDRRGQMAAVANHVAEVCALAFSDEMKLYCGPRALALFEETLANYEQRPEFKDEMHRAILSVCKCAADIHAAPFILLAKSLYSVLLEDDAYAAFKRTNPNYPGKF